MTLSHGMFQSAEGRLLETEQVIARGIVQQAGAGKITILLDSSAKGPQSPAFSDAVYVEASAGE